MAVDADPLHLLGVDGAGNDGGAIGRLFVVAGPGVDPPHTGEHGDVVGFLDVGRSPVVGGGASAPHAVHAGRDIAHPAVRAVAAHVIIVGAIGARLPGVVGPTPDGAIGLDRLGGLRAAAHLFSDLVSCQHRFEPPSSAAATCTAEPESVIIVTIQLPKETPLVEIGHTCNGPGLFFYAIKRRHQDCHQYRDNGYYHEKLYQSETSLLVHDDTPIYCKTNLKV